MEKAEKSNAGVELDKFKRRLIRAVARLLLHEKKPEEEIWKELRKETGCDCELLWTRMRALTIKKLEHFIAANDCMTAVPKAARMSLTDWLLLDLVLVHQKIDFIGQSKSKDKEDSPVLVELLELVKMFKIEFLNGDNLVEAWSSATLYYNSKGHHCSPMLLQRRWYQLKEVTRFKFYDYWYAYRGNLTRVNFAEPFKPSPLQTEIAKTYKQLVTRPFPEWEELIQKRQVILPEEFERKMKEKAAIIRPRRKPSQDIPDLVMIEPSIDTIDLRLEPDDDAAEDNQQIEEKDDNSSSSSNILPAVTIKQEPQDDMDFEETQVQPPKKSLYEVVLESTDLANEELDSMNASVVDSDEDEIDNEKNEEADGKEEESALPKIGSVFGNVSDTSVLGNIDEDRVYGNVENTEVRGSVDDTSFVNVGETNYVNDTVHGHDKETGDCDIVEDESTCVNEKESGACDSIDQNSARNNDAVIEVSSDDIEADTSCNVENVSEHVGETSPGGLPDEINEISDEDDVSDYVDATNDTGNIDKTSVTDNVDQTNVFGNVTHKVIETRVTGAVEVVGDVNKTNVTSEVEVSNAVDTSVSGNVELIGNVDETSATVEVATEVVASESKPIINTEIAYPTIIAALTAKVQCNTVTDTEAELNKDVEIIETTSDPVVIIDSDEEDHRAVDALVTDKTVPKSTEQDMAESKDTNDEPMELRTTEVLEDSLTEPLKVMEDAVKSDDSTGEKEETDIKPDIKSLEELEFADDGIIYVDEEAPTETKIKCEKQDEDDDAPVIDEKLLMFPIVYTTRLDDMGLFQKHIEPMHVNDKKILDTIFKKSKPIKKEPENSSNDTIENVTVNYCGETIESVTVNENRKTIEYVQKIVEENVSNKDSSILIKKEPEHVQSETVEDVPNDNIVPIVDVSNQNDNNVTSDDDDCEENVIDESQKVKPTSYLLQKPRSRRYHPIQLCKNPDFNTRLKRLSVGFFGSPRNRVLIKSCKPLTIDLSKSFESKLISGTLYLKPADHNVVTEIIDDTSHNVSVVPSALPAQSLIDNSRATDILPMFRQCLEVSKQVNVTEGVGQTSERNKVINLPDITEIRRINQQLLTAEVTPIQVQNNQPQVPVSIVTSSNTLPYPAQQTTTITEPATDMRPIVSEATDARGPPKLLEITDDPPATRPTEFNLTKHNLGYRLRPPQLAGLSLRLLNGKRLILPKPVIWKPRQQRPEIPWLSKNCDANYYSKKEDTLLTLDALNKMLFLLTDKQEAEVVVAPPKKPKPTKVKRKTSGQQPKKRGQQNSSPDDSRYMVLLRKADEVDVQASEAPSKCQKPKITIKPGSNYPPEKDIITEQPKKKVKYCCWARQKMLQMLFSREIIPVHGCRSICMCCCKTLLHDYIMHDQKVKSTELPLGCQLNAVSAPTEFVKTGFPKLTLPLMDMSIQVPDEATVHVLDVEDDRVRDIEKDQCSGTGTVSVPEDTSIIDVDATVTESASQTSTEYGPIDIDALDSEGDVPVAACEVSVTTTAEVETLSARGIEAPVNVTAKRKIVTVPIMKNHNLPGALPEISKPAYLYAHNIRSDNHPSRFIITPPSTAINHTITSPSTLGNLLAIKKSQTPNRFKINMHLPPILSKPFVPPKQLNEKMIFLNSKHISEKPSQNPVFLGKDKILLTTVKFPRNLKLFQEAKKALRSTLKIPDGVRLILLTDGSIVYKTDPNVKVNVAELTEMPAIIATVQAHMDAHDEELKEKTAFKESEVVDLIDDDDECAPKDNDNNETSLGTEVQTTQAFAIINKNDAPDVSHNTQMNASNETEENRTDLNINSTVKETESNQNDSADQYTVTEIQNDVQESSQNQTLSSSIERVNAEQDNQPKPYPNDTEIQKDVQESKENETLSLPIERVNAEQDDQTKPYPNDTEIQKDVQESSPNGTLSSPIERVNAEQDDQPKPYPNDTEIQKDVQESSQNEKLLSPIERVNTEQDDQPKPYPNDTEIQKDVQESSQNEKLLSPIERVNTEQDDQPKPYPNDTEIQKDVQESSQNETVSSPIERVNTEQDDQPKPYPNITEIQKDDQESSQNETLSSPIERVNAERDDQPKPSSQADSTIVHEVSLEHTLNQSYPTNQTVNAEKDDQSKPSSQTEHTEVNEVFSKQAQNQFEPSGQNVSIEAQDHLETAPHCVSPERPAESTSEPSKPKTKNILSDLMEMSGIFDEDITSEIEETQRAATHAAQTAEQVMMQFSLSAPLPAPNVADSPAPKVADPPAQEVVQPPPLAPLAAGTTEVRPILIPSWNKDNLVGQKLQSPLGELTPITSLYELKYACANKGLFFKLDVETKNLLPINVCMKPTIIKTKSRLRNIAPKSVIDLTEDDDKPENKDTEADTSPRKRSLLLVNNVDDDGFNDPVKPVKMFKALKPSVLQRLNQSKMTLDSKNPVFNNVRSHKEKRKQFLKNINLNTDVQEQPNSPQLLRRYVNKINVSRNSNNTFKITVEADEPTRRMSHTEPNKEFATTILSNDDSSDDEPLAKKAKRKHENLNALQANKNAPESGTKSLELELPAADEPLEAPAKKAKRKHKNLNALEANKNVPKSGTKYIEIELPAADLQLEAPVEKENEPELPAPDVEEVFMSVENDLIEPVSPVEIDMQTESELPPADTESFYISDNCNDSIDLDAPFGFESNEEYQDDEDDHCILGV